MEELPGGHASASGEQVNRFTAETVKKRQARVMAWVAIAFGVVLLVFGGMLFEVKHGGHDVVATVTHEGPCSNGTCTVDVAYDAAGTPVTAVMYGVPGNEIYGSSSHRLLNINYVSGGETSPTTNDMPDAVWAGVLAAGLAFVGWGAWWRRRNRSRPQPTVAAGGALAGAAVPAALTPAPADQPGRYGPARRSVPGSKWVSDESGAVTIAERYPRWRAITGTLFVAILPALMFPALLSHRHILIAVAYLVVATAVSIWGCFRGWRMALRLGHDGLMVRNYLRTDRISWPEVRCFADGSVKGGEAGRFWALDIVLRDGRVVTASGTPRGKRDARPETLTAIWEAADRYAIPEKLTGTAMKQGSPANSGLYPDPGGQPGLRRWNGREWSPFLLRADPADAKPAGEEPPAEVWSPLAGSQSQWHDVEARIKRAEVAIVVGLAVTAAIAILTVALYKRDLSNPQADYTMAVSALCATGIALFITIGVWGHRKNLKKIDQAGKAPASAAGGSGSSIAPLAANTPDGLPGQRTGPSRSRYKTLVVSGAGAVALIALITVIGVKISSPPSTNQLTVDQLRAGDCLVGSSMGLGTGSPWPDYVTRVACTKQHVAEVFFAGNIWSQSLAYPGDSAVSNQSDARCDSAFTAYDGVDNSISVFSYDYIVPASSDWASGDRLLVCVAYELSSSGSSGGTPVDYSIKGSNK